MTIVSGRWSMPGVADPPGSSVVGTPPRRAGSVRRTSHLTATFPARPAEPGTWGTHTTFTGAVRDLLTDGSGTAQVLSEDRVRLHVDPSRQLVRAECEPPHPGVSSLEGLSAGRGFRAAARAALPADDEGSPALYYLLDDLSVLSGISGVAWSQHRPFEIPVEEVSDNQKAFQRTSTGRIACSGLRPGGYHEQSWQRGAAFPHWVQPAGDLGVGDPWGWHDIEPAAEVCFRRRRRVDVWQDGPATEVDAHFRDSIWAKGGVEVALHEYSVRAAVDHDGVVLRMEAEGEVLPFPECPWAAPHADKLIGLPVGALRSSVPETLTELEACSHLNDMLRGLADVPDLARAIDGRG